MFDVTRKITYKNLKKWYGEMRKHCPKIPCILIANKIDGKLFEKRYTLLKYYKLKRV